MILCPVCLSTVVLGVLCAVPALGLLISLVRQWTHRCDDHSCCNHAEDRNTLGQ